MKISTDDKGNIVVTEVYNPAILRTNRGEELSISMRDSGFEFVYDNVRYEAKHGKLRRMGYTTTKTLFFDDMVQWFVRQHFGDGFPVTAMDTWSADVHQAFWKFVTKMLFIQKADLVQVPDVYELLYKQALGEAQKMTEVI